MLSIIINFDTRPTNFDAPTMFEGVRCHELLVQNLLNKRQFFERHDAEFIVYVDEHERLDDGILAEMRALSDSFTLRRHTKRYRQWDRFDKFNDINYLAALTQARGDIVVHFDGDASCFAKDKAAIDRWLGFLDTYKFVSYPSHWSPGPTVDETFDHWWVSTRAFACRRESLAFDEIEKCLTDTDYIWQRHGDFKRKHPWMEHILSYINDRSVIYPPMTDDLLMFCWRRYAQGVMTSLNQRSFEDVKAYVRASGGITYPCDVEAMPL